MPGILAALRENLWATSGETVSVEEIVQICDKLKCRLTKELVEAALKLPTHMSFSTAFIDIRVSRTKKRSGQILMRSSRAAAIFIVFENKVVVQIAKRTLKMIVGRKKLLAAACRVAKTKPVSSSSGAPVMV